MGNYFEFSLKNLVNQEILLDKLHKEMSNIIWRPGDSDYQGKYIKGYHESGADFALWLDDYPAYFVGDLRGVAPEALQAGQKLVHAICDLLARLGIAIHNERG